jgi:hypothetical protein
MERHGFQPEEAVAKFASKERQIEQEDDSVYGSGVLLTGSDGEKLF